MADDNTIIEGTVKFRDGKKWKSRWCVMRKLSPVADCVQLQVYRDARARCGGAGCKASLALQHFLGSESGFTLDKHSNTLALLCTDLVAILAFETRERLIQWQVKVNIHLGEPRHYLVLVGAGSASRLPAGPARLHVRGRRCALSSGAPPRLLGVWEIAHLRRYGVVEGRFCFEGGSHCGKGEGLHTLITDQAKDIVNDFNLAAQGRLSPKRRIINKNDGISSPKLHNTFRPETRLSELNTIDISLPPTDTRFYEDACIGEDVGGISPYWPSAERTNFQDMGLSDTTSVNENLEGTSTALWNGQGNVTLERCMSCMSKLGGLSRSSTAALTPGAKHFSPAWTMEAVQDNQLKQPVDAMGSTVSHCDINISSKTYKTEDSCRCSERPPERPPKPNRLELNLNKKPALSLPLHSGRKEFSVNAEVHASKIGPYENYDIPKVSRTEVFDAEYYDTPKRLKECINSELFKVTKNSTSNSIILKKPCGCLLKFGKRLKEPMIVDTEENFQQTNCPCQRVTDWAHNWIKIPYCKKKNPPHESSVPNKENLMPTSASEHSALYATIDVSRKINRKMQTIDRKAVTPDSFLHTSVDAKRIEIDNGPLANYENLNFALSLEHYENAKDLLKKAGVTQLELDAISANLRPTSFSMKNGKNICIKCGHSPAVSQKEEDKEIKWKSHNDEYLMMEPNSMELLETQNLKISSSGYTPMSPIGSLVYQALKHNSKNPISRLLDEKSASNPTLSGTSPDDDKPRDDMKLNIEEIYSSQSTVDRVDKIEFRKRSSSADSTRFLEDVKEFDSSVGSHGSSSSIETLRNMSLDVERNLTSCDCVVDNKNSDADSSETSKGAREKVRGVPPAKRSSSVPVKAGANRDSSSSNDSGVSSCSLRPGAEFELPLTTAAARRFYRSTQRAAGLHASLPRRSKSTDPLRDCAAQRERVPAKSSSAEAEIPVLSIKLLRGVVDNHSTSSGTSDMSDYIETLSICSSHSSTDTPITMRVVRQTTSTLRPRSGKEYQNLDPRLTSLYRAAHRHYTNLP